MARTDKPRSVRRDASLQEGRRDVALQAGRRFFTARGAGKAEREARALQGLLGVGLEAYADKLGRENVAGTSRAAQQAAAGGPRDPDDPNKGYNEAFDQVEAANDLAIFANELPQMLDKVGWRDLSEDDAQAHIDQYYAEQLTGINPESVYGQLVSEGILTQNAELLQTHRTYKAEQAQQERRIMVFNELRADYELTGKVDHKKLMERLKILVPGPGGRLTYVESVIDLSEEIGDPTPIETMPDYFPSGDPTGKTDPKFKDDVIDPGLGKAYAQQARNQKAAVAQFEADYQTERAGAHSDLTTRAKAGDASVFYDIGAGGEKGPPSAMFPNGTPPLLTRPHQKTLFDQLVTGQEKIAIDSVGGDLFGAGKAFGMTETEYDNAAVVHAGRLDTKYRREHPDWDDDRVESETLKAMIERSWRHDLVPKYIANMIDATPANPERFKEAVNVKAMIDAYDPSLFQRTVSDRNAAMMRSYELALRDTGNEDTALEHLTQYDASLLDGRQKEIVEIANEALDNMASDPWWADYPITFKDRQRAERLAKHYLALGHEDDRVVKFLEDGMRARNSRVQGVLYPVDSGWVKGDEAVEAYLKVTPGDIWPADAELVMKPHPTKHGYVVIQDSNAILPYASPERSIAEVERWYADSIHDQTLRLSEDAKAPVSEMVKAAEQRAFLKAFPPPLVGKPELIYVLTQRQEAQWAAMDDAQRQRLIQAEQTNPLQ